MIVTQEDVDNQNLWFIYKQALFFLDVAGRGICFKNQTYDSLKRCGECDSCRAYNTAKEMREFLKE